MYNLIQTTYHALLKYKTKKYIDSLEQKGLKLGNNVTIMDGFFLDPTHCYLITIGNNCTLAPNVRLIAHDASMKFSLGYTKIGRITIEDNCFLGDSVIVMPGVNIGESCIIGAGSVVAKSVPPCSIAAGNPCKVIRSYSDCLKKNEARLLTRMSPYGSIKQKELIYDQKQEILDFLSYDIGYIR